MLIFITRNTTMFRSLLFLLSLVAACAADVPFFFNNVTGVSAWERPAHMPYFTEGRPYWLSDNVPSWTAPEPADRWTPHASADGAQYFTHEDGTTSWDRPAVFGWSVRSSTEHFWYNRVTHATQNERPDVVGIDSAEHNATFYHVGDGETTWDAPDASSWVEVVDPATSRPYFHNQKTGDVTWDAPLDSNVAWIKWFKEIDSVSELR